MPQRGRRVKKASSPSTKSSSTRPWRTYAAVVGLLAWYYFTAVTAVLDKSLTYDELLHVTAGYTAWRFGDFRMQPENGILPQRLGALPLVFRNTHFPDRDQDAWRTSANSFGDQFFHSVGNDERSMLIRCRAMMALLGVALGALIFFWARSLLGAAAALVSLGLFAFCPTVLANGPLVTSDLAVTLFFSATMLCIWRVLHRVTWQNVVVGSLVMGCLFVSKFSAILIVPMGLLLIALQLISRNPTVVTFRGKTWTFEHRAARLAIHLATIALNTVGVCAVIWAFYNFRYDMFATTKSVANDAGEMFVVDRPSIPWELLLKDSPTLAPIINQVREMHLLPEAYLYGFVYTLRFSEGRTAFFNGECRLTGWREFFPYCLLVKTPLTLFLLLTLAAAWVIRSWYYPGESWDERGRSMLRSLYRTAPLWVLFVVYWAFAINSRLNIGHRHLLPTYPPMLIFAGVSWFRLAHWTTDPAPQSLALSRWLPTRRWPLPACLVLLCLGLFAAESLWRWPNYLAYFNQVVGGPSKAYRHLVDSSLDWGQDLPALRRWLEKEKQNLAATNSAYLSYFGVASPQYYGIPATLLFSYPRQTAPAVPEPLHPGTYCISATMLQNVYNQFRGHWTRRSEARYQELASKVREFQNASADERRSLIAKDGAPFWNRAFQLYEQARFARLSSFLREREPDANINYSILVYRLNAADVASAVEGPPVELDETPMEEVVVEESADTPK